VIAHADISGLVYSVLAKKFQSKNRGGQNEVMIKMMVAGVKKIFSSERLKNSPLQPSQPQHNLSGSDANFFSKIFSKFHARKKRGYATT
jgi:formamidopyrimidine-DNA glycosylase